MKTKKALWILGLATVGLAGAIALLACDMASSTSHFRPRDAAGAQAPSVGQVRFPTSSRSALVATNLRLLARAGARSGRSQR